MRRLGRRQRRVLLTVASVFATFVVVIVAVSLSNAQSDARRTVEERFSYGPSAAAALVATIVSQAFANDAALGARLLSEPDPSPQRLREASTRVGGQPLVLIDAERRVVGAYPAASRPPGDDPHIRQALAGKPAISGELRAGNRRFVEVAVPFSTPVGRRVIVLTTRLAQVQRVLGPYLENLPGLAGHRTYILDPRNAVLAASDGAGAPEPTLKQALGRGPKTLDGSYDDGERRFSSFAIAGTPWAVVDTVDASVLYSPVEGWQTYLPWILLAALLPAGAFIIILAERAGSAAERSQKASEAKSAFLANMSHELRTPMTTILGFSEMLAKGRLGELSDRQREVIGHIHTSSEHLNRLIAEVLDLARVEEGRMAFHPEEVRPDRLVAEVADSMRGLAQDRGIAIHVDAADIGTFRLDPARFKQVLYNLIGNAVKFTEAGGDITVRLARNEHGELAVTVSDTGAGIGPEDLERIFLPFEQGDAHRSGGAGLGLAVSRHIIDAQGGRIGVLSEPGRGSTFTVTLPSSHR